MRPSPKLRPKDRALLSQYCSFAKRQDFKNVDLLENSDPWRALPIGYFVDLADNAELRISRALMPFHWSWCSWGKQRCKAWHSLRCRPEDPLVLQWHGLRSSFRECRFTIVPDLRIYDGAVYYAIVDNISYPKVWIQNRELLNDLCGDFQTAVDQRMLVDGAGSIFG